MEFKKGDRVIATNAAWKQGCFPRHAIPPIYGTVVGMADDPNFVRVVQEGQKTPYTYSRNFWQTVN